MEEESELLKERLQAITDKGKLQEGIAKRRVTIEEEKIKLHHLKKKALREKWLLDGLSTMSPEEQEETLRQSQEDQQQIKNLEHRIVRLEQEIQDLENEEVQLSNKEVRVLQRLKSVERTTEDIIKAVKAVKREEPESPIRDIYADIPDLPASYKPQFVKRLEKALEEIGEEPRQALFAMEIKVHKDMKTGKSTVLSSIPVPSSEVKDAGVKVYDDGRKSVFAVSSKGGVAKNGVDSLAPVEVEDILRKATEKTSQSPTEYHEPVFSFSFNNSSSQKGQISQRTNGHVSSHTENQENSFNKNGKLASEDMSHAKVSTQVTLVKEATPEGPVAAPSQPRVFTQNRPNIQEDPGHQIKSKEDFRGPMIPNSAPYTTFDSSHLEEDTRYNFVHTHPCNTDESEPVTMIFMGYKDADEAESKALTDYEGVIRAELVVIGDEELPENSLNTHSFPHVSQQTQVYRPKVPNYTDQKLPSEEVTVNSHVAYKNSMTLQEQEATLGRNNIPLPAKPVIDDGTEDPSLSALRIRMAKLGKKVI
uniref:Palmdelphin n=1 Tax=Leptobrachium leishanense TaxID=445787 RepID=A0A8C5WKY9_9ANUR